MVREKFTVSTRQEINTFLAKVDHHFSKQFKLDKQDGIKVLFNTGWIHVRPSNTEPIIRIFIEEESLEKANLLYKEVIALK